MVEYFTYERPSAKRLEKEEIKTISNAKKDVTEGEKKQNRVNSTLRARKAIRRLINANVGQYYKPNGSPYPPIFATITFKENIQDIKQANYEFKKFRQRLEYQQQIKLKYLVVVEFQQRGAIHYHAIFFNLPYLSTNEIAAIWRNGFIKLNRIDEVDNIGAYVCKYLGKDLEDDRLAGQKSYFCSKGLKKPTEITNKKEIDQLLAGLSEKSIRFENTFENEYHGQILYRQYLL